MSEQDALPGGNLTADQLIESMVIGSIGLDKPMTPKAVEDAGDEVLLRLDTAALVLTGEIPATNYDTLAMAALLLSLPTEE